MESKILDKFNNLKDGVKWTIYIIAGMVIGALFRFLFY